MSKSIIQLTAGAYRHPIERPDRKDTRKAQIRKNLSKEEDASVELARSILARRVVGGDTSLAAIAQRAGISVRTLQRRVRAAGLTYMDLQAAVRLEYARDLLADRSRSVCEVASTLGYSDAANFCRAFKRWTNMTPSEFRESPKS